MKPILQVEGKHQKGIVPGRTTIAPVNSFTELQGLNSSSGLWGVAGPEFKAAITFIKALRAPLLEVNLIQTA